MEILINSCAIKHTSSGVKRYYKNVAKYLENTYSLKYTKLSHIKNIDKIIEILHPGSNKYLLWSPSHRGPINAHNHVVTVHDCININYSNSTSKKLILEHITKKLLKNSSRIISISESTKTEIINNYHISPDLITVIKSSNIPDISSGCIQKLNLRPYILIVSNNLKHKNTMNACQAISLSRAAKLNIEVRVVGSIDPRGESYLKEKGIPIHYERSISDERLLALYKNSLFLFSPSLEEGHNLPIAEALSVNTNVLCSSISAHKEFYEGYVNFFNPILIEDMIESINISLDNSNKKWFPSPVWNRTFKDVANDYISVFQSVEK